MMSGIGGAMAFGGGRMPDMAQMRERMFAKADANGDQGLSLEEFQKAGKNMPGGNQLSADRAAEAFGRMDADGNGSVSKTEMTAAGDRISEQMRSMMTDMQAQGAFMDGGGGQMDTLLQAMGAYGGGQQRSSDLTQTLLQSLERDDGQRERADVRA